MSRRSSRRKKAERGRSSRRTAADERRAYQKACELAVAGAHEDARQILRRLQAGVADAQLQALVHNDLGVLAAVAGRPQEAADSFAAALACDPECLQARANLAMLRAEYPLQEADAGNGQVRESESASGVERKRTDASGAARQAAATEDIALSAARQAAPTAACRVAILSFLFNWPSTGGGIVHTVELAQFLAKAGYEVRHFYAKHPAWGVGVVEKPLPFETEGLEFAGASWTATEIQHGFRRAVDRFDPDVVVITDSWNMKPILAEAVRGYPYLLRQQALECLCPLNNLRLLVDAGGQVSQCPKNQLATPADCRQCLLQRGRASGRLHQAERALAAVGTPEYDQLLRRAFAEAQAVLVLNPLVEALVNHYARQVRVVTWGMDPRRFPWPWPNELPDEPRRTEPRPTLRLIMAGLVEEFIKGFHVLEEACRKLWRKRHDFELVATADPPGRVNEFTRYIGWLSQDELPGHIRAADVLVMPTIAQEGLGRTTVEAMGVGRPVIASRIGGLPFTVTEGVTGLLFEPGDADDLARKIELLLDGADLRQRMGLAGRRRFEAEFTWEAVIERHYRPLLKRRDRAIVGAACRAAR